MGDGSVRNRMDAPAAMAEDRGPEPLSASGLRISRVETFLVPWAETTDAMIRQVDASLLEIGRFAAGELVVIVSGSPPGQVGKTNLLRVHKIGEDSR